MKPEIIKLIEENPDQGGISSVRIAAQTCEENRMIKIKGEGTSLDWRIINAIKDVSVKNIEFKNITFECETIIDAAGHIFVRQESREKQNEAD